MTRALALAAAAAIAATTAAVAEPARRTAVDPDLAAEQRSGFWEEAVRPGTAANRVRLDDALRLLRLPTGDRKLAAEHLTAITVTTPDDPDGWGYLAIASEMLRRWPECAAAYARARALDPQWRPARLLDARPSSRDPKLRPLPLSIALCQGKAGALDDAARTLADAIARGEATPAVWLRAGEIAMAQGRLDDAIAALERAGAEPGARWLLAIAYDRARRDDRAQAAAELAHAADPHARDAGALAGLALVPSDGDYMIAFAAARQGRPEEALAHFRRYLAAVAEGPWRARAREHLDALARTDLAARASIEGVVPAAEQRALQAAIRAAQPALAACVAQVPSGLQQLKLVRTGPPDLKPLPWPVRPAPGRPARPRAGVPDRTRVPWPPPPPRPPAPRATSAAATTTIAASAVVSPIRAELPGLDQAHACLERVGATLKLPPVAPGGELVVRIPVIPR